MAKVLLSLETKEDREVRRTRTGSTVKSNDRRAARRRLADPNTVGRKTPGRIDYVRKRAERKEKARKRLEAAYAAAPV